MRHILTILFFAVVATANALAHPDASQGLELPGPTSEDVAIECGKLGVMEVPSGEDPAKYRKCRDHPTGLSGPSLEEVEGGPEEMEDKVTPVTPLVRTRREIRLAKRQCCVTTREAGAGLLSMVAGGRGQGVLIGFSARPVILDLVVVEDAVVDDMNSATRTADPIQHLPYTHQSFRVSIKHVHKYITLGNMGRSL
ncbi:hypothetical protein BKA66DRAFT_448015 [Pyrenochaeta sp. MPI-SDFR-AT-0127]|nr:hypothetical protein BKA66DRAFT_448015 [Pyrenochaeta sp. MPI-SDFR-AT-0127]